MYLDSFIYFAMAIRQLVVIHRYNIYIRVYWYGLELLADKEKRL